jgi:hypothetical protein
MALPVPRGVHWYCAKRRDLILEPTKPISQPSSDAALVDHGGGNDPTQWHKRDRADGVPAASNINVLSL